MILHEQQTTPPLQLASLAADLTARGGIIINSSKSDSNDLQTFHRHTFVEVQRVAIARNLRVLLHVL